MNVIIRAVRHLKDGTVNARVIGQNEKGLHQLHWTDRYPLSHELNAVGDAEWWAKKNGHHIIDNVGAEEA